VYECVQERNHSHGHDPRKKGILRKARASRQALVNSKEQEEEKRQLGVS